MQGKAAVEGCVVEGGDTDGIWAFISPCPHPALLPWHICSHSLIPVPHPTQGRAWLRPCPTQHRAAGGTRGQSSAAATCPPPRCSSGFSREAPPCSAMGDPAQGFPGAFQSCFVDCQGRDGGWEERRRTGGDAWPGRGGMFLCHWELLYFVPWFCTTGRVFLLSFL